MDEFTLQDSHASEAFMKKLTFLIALFLLSCSSQKFLGSQFKTSTTPLKLLPEVSKLAKDQAPEAVLVSIISSDNWQDGLVVWTNEEIDKSYVEPTGTSPRWDFYFAKSAADLLPKDGRADLFAVKQEQLFGFRYIAADSNAGKGGYVKLASKQFAPEFNILSQQALQSPKIDSDQALQIAQKNIAERFTSLKVGNLLKRERREITNVAYSLQQDPKVGPIWELGAIFADSFGDKKGALLYVNATDGSIPPWEINPFDIKVEIVREGLGKNKVNVREVRTRDFTKSKELLAEWIAQTQSAAELTQLLQQVPAAATATP